MPESRMPAPSLPPVAAGVAPAWSGPLVALAAVLAWILLWYRDTAAGMVLIWARSETFTHGFVVLPLSLWLIWRRRAVLAPLAPRPSLVVLPLVALAGLGWLVGELAAVNAATQLMLVAMLVLATVAVLGVRVAREMAFPLGFLFFAVPIGEFLLPTLMAWTADFTVAAIRLSGVPVYREGQHFSIPTGNWSVVEACSGVRYLIASLMIGTIYAYLSYRSVGRRLAFVGVSIAVPILANWVRAYLIVMLGHLSGNRIAVGVDHLIYGWLFFGVVMALMFWIGALWQEAPAASAPAAPRTAGPSAPGAGRAWRAAALVAAVAGAWPLAYARIDAPGGAPAPVLSPLRDTGAWQRDVAIEGLLKPRYERPNAELVGGYSAGGPPVGLYVGYYRDQDQQRKLVSSENVVVSHEDARWIITSSGAREVAVGGQPVAVRETRLRGGAQRLVVWQWYWIDGRLTSSTVRAKVDTVLAQLARGRDDSAVVVLYAPEGRPGDAERALAAFAREAWPALDARLRAARDGPAAEAPR